MKIKLIHVWYLEPASHPEAVLLGTTFQMKDSQPLQPVSCLALSFVSPGRQGRLHWSLEAYQTELRRYPCCSCTDNTLTLFTLIQK